MAGSFGRETHVDLGKHQPQDLRPLEPTKSVPIQAPELLGQDATQYEWRLNPIDALNHDVTETLNRIAGTASHIKGPQALKQTRDTSPPPLCVFCSHVFTHLKPNPPREDAPKYIGGLWTPDGKTQSTTQFERSATEITCGVCRWRWNQLEVGERESLVKDVGEDDILLHPNTLPLQLKFKYPFAEFPKALLLAPCHDTEVISLSSVSESCNSTTSWTLANFWLQRCVSSHGKCRKLAVPEPKLPTRLVYLCPEAHTARPRLCHSVNLLPDIRYATLSHRWGGSIMSMLTLAAVQFWTDAIPISILSVTFKEAMEATKRLGMRYLWIDSLCIIQDSDEDWRRELAAMGDVYRNSYCSISAAAGHSVDNQGLFAHRDPRDIYPSVVKPQHALWKGGDCQEWYCFPRDLFEQNVTQSPLLARGWVVQEHILAPRILHFAAQQLFWECLELQACETLPAGMLNTRKLRQKKLSIDTSSLPGEYYDTPYREGAQRAFLWNEFVERFSTTALTHPEKDKLAALSGLAKAVGVQSEYLAGIWRGHLAVHLMWGRHGGSAILERPEKYQAPSWSWASVNGRIFTTRVWPLEGEGVVADVLDGHVELVGADPTGPVKAGWLRLRGCLAPVKVRKWPPRKGYVEIWDYNINGDDKIQCHPDIDFDDGQEEAMLYCFLVTLSAEYPFTGAGILLEPTGVRKGEFYRRGRFLCGPYQKEELMQPFLDLFRTSVTTLGPDCFISGPEYVESVCGLPMYEISII